MKTANGAILYRAGRVRFVIATLLFVPLSLLAIFLGYDGIALGDKDVRNAWLMIPMAPVFLWLDYVIIAKLIWPPELEISPEGVRWANAAMQQRGASYTWDEIDGPEQVSGVNGVPLLQMIVKATGKKLALPPSHFGVSYDEIATAISAARGGRQVSSEH